VFKIKQSDSYVWPVTVEIPISGGTFQKSTFQAEFKRIAQSRFREMLASETADRDVCREVLIGWKEVIGEDGKDEPFSESARDNLLEVPLVAGAITQAFIESFTGGAKRKN
jgi:hypothetical protein